MKRLAPAFLLGMLAALPAAASVTPLTFSGNICATSDGKCSNGSFVSQSYGDVYQGKALLLDVVYAFDVGAKESLAFWADGYAGLKDVAYGASGGTPEIAFLPAAGYQVKLLSFELGSWGGTERSTQVSLLDGATSVFSQAFSVARTPVTFDDKNKANYALPDLWSTAGLRLRFGPDGYNVGIDNIKFQVTPVPEPGTLALFLAGIGMMGFAIRRRAG